MSSRSIISGLAALAALVVAGSPPAAAQSLKIGVFDPARVSQETSEGSRIQARLTSLQQRKSDELKSLQDEIRNLEQEFVNTAASLSTDKRKELGLRIERKRFELEGLQKSASRELQLEVEQAQAEWQGRVLEAVRKLGQEQSYTLILQFDLVAFHSSTVDVTDELIRRIDGGEGGGVGGQGGGAGGQ
ncbi:MAG: OmpH family outer membrane protein [Acidobacteriota bacterium]|nr:OmpH family outer membrane protein [Acidobacteriota bacterium]